jgi:uncharacterized protein
MMKYFLLFVVLYVAYLMWRNGRLAARKERRPPPQQAPTSPQDMVRCPICGVHLPRPDAVAGTNGLLYCSQEHRLKAGV